MADLAALRTLTTRKQSLNVLTPLTLPAVRVDGRVVSWPDDTLWWIGGTVDHNGNNTTYDTIFEYNYPTQEWFDTGIKLPVSLRSFCACVMDSDMLVVAGGVTSPTVYQTAVYSFSRTTRKWTTRTPFAAGFAEAVCVAYDTKMVVALGVDSTITNLNTVWEIDTVTWAITAKTAAPTNVYGAAYARQPDGKLVVAGGYSGGAKSNVWVFNPADYSWTAKSALPAVRYRMVAVVDKASELSSQIVFIGGIDSGGAATSTIWIYQTSTGLTRVAGVSSTSVVYRNMAARAGRDIVIPSGQVPPTTACQQVSILQPSEIDALFAQGTYTGNGTSQSVNVGLNLTAGDWMVWITSDTAQPYQDIAFDTKNGVGNFCNLHANGSQGTDAQSLTAFTSTGFNVGNSLKVNGNGVTYYYYAFKVKAGFFDIVKWTGDGTASRDIAYGLGVLSSLILIRTPATVSYWVNPPTSDSYYDFANNNPIVDATVFKGAGHTTSGFRVGSSTKVNGSGTAYTAYVWGTSQQVPTPLWYSSYSGNGSTPGVALDLKAEPQFLLIKNLTSNGASAISVYDSLGSGTTSPRKFKNPGFAAFESTGSMNFLSNGLQPSSAVNNVSGQSYGYLFIARGTK